MDKDKIVGVKMDVVAPFVAKVNEVAKENEGKYVLKEEKFLHVVDMYRKFKKFASENNGYIKFIDVTPGRDVLLDANIHDIDAYKDVLKLFSDILSGINNFDAFQCDDDMLSVSITLPDIWEKANE